MTTVLIRRLVGEAAVMLAVTAGPYALSAVPASACSGSPDCNGGPPPARA